MFEFLVPNIIRSRIRYFQQITLIIRHRLFHVQQIVYVWSPNPINNYTSDFSSSRNTLSLESELLDIGFGVFNKYIMFGVWILHIHQTHYVGSSNYNHTQRSSLDFNHNQTSASTFQTNTLQLESVFETNTLAVVSEFFI